MYNKNNMEMSKIFFSRKHSIGKETKNGDVVFNIKINDTDEIKLPYTLNGKVSYLNEFYEDLDDVVSGESTKLNFEFAIQTTSKTTAINKTEFTDSFYEYYRLKRIGLHNENRKNFLTLVVLGIFAIILFILLGVLDYFIIENSDDTVVTSIKLTCEIF
ncbi:hypothetical protein FACS189459_5720 [Bacilli bacterium]|nr:hypothetical protein FACS189459_5720 [Bacilli bacterium]